MNFSKLLLTLCLFIVLVNSTPVPNNIFGNLFSNLFGNHNNDQNPAPVEAPIDVPIDVPIEVPVDAPKDEDIGIPPIDTPVYPPHKDDESPVDAPVDDPVDAPVEPPKDNEHKNVFDDIVSPITEGEIDDHTDIANLVTDGVTRVLKDNLCAKIDNQLSQVCSQVSESVINAASGALKGIISASIKTASGNSVTIACAVIPSDIFRKLSSVIVDAIIKEISKNGQTDVAMAEKIANNVINIIINTVENLLCAGRSKDNIGNVVIKGVSGFVNNIKDKVKNLNKNAKSFTLHGHGHGHKHTPKDEFAESISKDVLEFQKSLSHFN